MTKQNFCVALIGNPNCGKTALFNVLTGSNQRVGNWSGVTVDKKTGSFTIEGKQFEIVDLPGIYSLNHHKTSLDEQIAKEFLSSKNVDLILNIVDASQLERHLSLTSQLMEYGTPMVLVANMMDELSKQKTELDVKGLQSALHIPVVPTIASKKQGIEELKQQLLHQIDHKTVPQPIVKIPELQSYFDALQPVIIENMPMDDIRQLAGYSRRLFEDEHQQALLKQHDKHKIIDAIETAKSEIAHKGLDIDIVINAARFDFATEIKKQFYNGKQTLSHNNLLDKLVFHRYLGFPIFLFVMYMMFLIAVKFGDAFIDFFDILGGAIFVDGIKELLTKIHAPELLILIIADGIGGGIQTVLTFIPVIGALFFVLAILEDSGYLARAAVVVDSLMSKLGLSGKAFVPLITGFGCTVAAIMGSRILDQKRDRMMTIAMAPFMSCSARLPVYIFLAAAFFPGLGQNIVFLLYIFGILMAIITGLILQRTILNSDPQPMVIEIPRWHLPILSNVWRATWHRMHSFVIRAGKVIIPVVMLITALNNISLNGSVIKEANETSILSSIAQSTTVIFQPMGIEQKNWPATVGIITGILAKEVSVGSMSNLYAQIGSSASASSEEETSYSLTASAVEALTAVKDNVLALSSSFTDPLGINVGDLTEQDAIAQELDIEQEQFAMVQNYFNGATGAFAFLLFILLYMPCTAASAAIVRAQGAKWTLFIVAWTNILAWSSAVIFYQLAHITQHPLSSIAWISFSAILLIAFWLLVIRIDRRYSDLERSNINCALEQV